MSRFASSPRPTDSRFGPVRLATELLPGIWKIQTATTSALILSDGRQAAMPDALRNADGCYDIEIDAPKVYHVFADELIAAGTPPKMIEVARAIVREWHDQAWQALTGESPSPRNDAMRAQRQRGLDAIGQLAVASAVRIDNDDYPDKNATAVSARRITGVEAMGFLRYDYDEPAVERVVNREAYHAAYLAGGPILLEPLPIVERAA